MTNGYSETVSKLIKLGRPGDPWQDYAALGITPAHIPELIRLVDDYELRWMKPPEDLPEGEEFPDWYAQIHAWRALAQLKAEEAISAIIGILYQIDEEDDDWLSSDAQDVFALIGTAAVGPLSQYLADDSNPIYARSVAGSSLAKIGMAHPESRDRCAQAIAAVLEKYENNDEGLNGFLIGDLVDLKAVEQIELIERAFAAEAVDEFINGDVEDVQIELGLLEERLTPERPWRIGFNPGIEEIFTTLPQQPRKDDKKQKNKRKQEKKSPRRIGSGNDQDV